MEINFLSYNIHKGMSLLNRRSTLVGIRDFLEDMNFDIVFLQEVQGLNLNGDFENQLEHLADNLWPHWAYGKNAVYSDSHHGNAILSKFPLEIESNYDVTLNRWERRGVLYGKVFLGEPTRPLHLFCLHFNLLEKDRALQVDKLLNLVNDIVPNNEPVIIGGDFNDWRGSAIKKMENSFDLLSSQKRPTYPNFFPVLSLDRLFARHIELISLTTTISDKHRQLSDHLPLVARLTVRMG